MGTLHEDPRTFVIISCFILLRIKKMLRTKSVEKIKTHFNAQHIFPERVSFIVDPDRQQMSDHSYSV